MGSPKPVPGRILISGGGIAGLTLAAALHQRGFEAEVVERSADGGALGAGIAVQPNGMRVLREVGLASAVTGAGSVIRHWRFRDQHGDVLSDTDLEALWGEVGPFIGIERTALQEALRAGAAPVPCRLGTWVTALRQDERGISAEFNDGAGADYALVVGADGILSTTRQLALGPAAPVYGGQMVWRSVAPIQSRELDGVEFWLGDGCFFGLCPVGEGRAYGFGNATQPRLHDAIQGRAERLRARFAGFGGLVREYLDNLPPDDQIHCGPIEWVELPRWHAGRAVLVGDAAHATSPMMGQGGSMAMEDALVLAESLCSTPCVETALDLFVARRRPRVEVVQQGSRAAVVTLGMPPAVRNAILRDRGDTLLRARFQPLLSPP